jgi:hypothetical protein
VTGSTRHLIHGGESTEVAARIAWVEIEASDGAYYLFYFDANGDCLVDTWHETLERAKAQARFELEIEEIDWKDMDGNA